VLLLTSGGGQVGDVTTGQVTGLRQFHPEGGIERVALSPDGQTVLLRGADRVARLWDLATGKPLGPRLSLDAVGPIALSTDGRLLAVADRPGRISLWHVPRPLKSTPEGVRRWVEVQTGMELDDHEAVHKLSPDALAERRQRLEELGGAPPIP
jgi:WD40 repeat protein